MTLRFPLIVVALLVGCSSLYEARGVGIEIVPGEFEGAIQPQAVAAPGGKIHVVFGKDGAIYHTASSSETLSFSKPVQVGALPKLALGMRRGPRVAATDQRICISAISHETGNLLVWISADAGATWSEPAQINTTPNSAREGLHAMAGSGSGFVVLVWLDLRNGGMELWSASSRDGGASWGANTLVYQSPDGHICECCHPSVAISPEGEIAVMWRNWLDGSRDMYLTLSKDGGTAFSAAQKLGEGTWKLKGCPMDGGALAYSAEGNLVTTWRREKTVFVATVSEPETELADTGLQPVVFQGKTGTNVLWQSGSRLMLQKEKAKPVVFAEGASFPAVASVPGKAPVVVWESIEGNVRTLRADRLE